MFGIASAVFSTVGGLLIGAIKAIWMRNIEAKIAERDALFRAAGIQVADTNSARKMQGKGVQFTRRLLALSFAFAVLIVPSILVLMDNNVVFNIPVITSDSGFSLLFGLLSSNTGDGIDYIQVQGYVYLVSLIDLFGLVVGFYFGSDGTNKRV